MVSGIAAGPDGTLWFIDPMAGRFERISSRGTITELPATSIVGKRIGGFTIGPDGAVWFTEIERGVIGRISALAYSR